MVRVLWRHMMLLVLNEVTHSVISIPLERCTMFSKISNRAIFGSELPLEESFSLIVMTVVNNRGLCRYYALVPQILVNSISVPIYARLHQVITWNDAVFSRNTHRYILWENVNSLSYIWFRFGWNNSLSPARHHVITRTTADLSLVRPLGTNV